MTLDDIDLFCRNLPGASVRNPFDTHPDIRSWCIGRKMFAWTNTSYQPTVVQLKADPDIMPSLTANYPGIGPGYHMNKRHWISVDASACDPDVLIGLLEDSHNLVAVMLPRTERLRLLGD